MRIAPCSQALSLQSPWIFPGLTLSRLGWTVPLMEDQAVNLLYSDFSSAKWCFFITWKCEKHEFKYFSGSRRLWRKRYVGAASANTPGVFRGYYSFTCAESSSHAMWPQLHVGISLLTGAVSTPEYYRKVKSLWVFEVQHCLAIYLSSTFQIS